jgi:hypothetical protein
MNRQSLKQVQTHLDEVVAAIQYCQTQETYPGAGALSFWLSTLHAARIELLDFEASLSPQYMVDMRGVVCNGE